MRYNSLGTGVLRLGPSGSCSSDLAPGGTLSSLKDKGIDDTFRGAQRGRLK